MKFIEEDDPLWCRALEKLPPPPVVLTVVDPYGLEPDKPSTLEGRRLLEAVKKRLEALRGSR